MTWRSSLLLLTLLFSPYTVQAEIIVVWDLTYSSRLSEETGEIADSCESVYTKLCTEKIRENFPTATCKTFWGFNWIKIDDGIRFNGTEEERERQIKERQDEMTTYFQNALNKGWGTKLKEECVRYRKKEIEKHPSQIKVPARFRRDFSTYVRKNMKCRYPGFLLKSGVMFEECLGLCKGDCIYVQYDSGECQKCPVYRTEGSYEENGVTISITSSRSVVAKKVPYITEAQLQNCKRNDSDKVFFGSDMFKVSKDVLIKGVSAIVHKVQNLSQPDKWVLFAQDESRGHTNKVFEYSVSKKMIAVAGEKMKALTQDLKLIEVECTDNTNQKAVYKSVGAESFSWREKNLKTVIEDGKAIPTKPKNWTLNGKKLESTEIKSWGPENKVWKPFINDLQFLRRNGLITKQVKQTNFRDMFHVQIIVNSRPISQKMKQEFLYDVKNDTVRLFLYDFVEGDFDFTEDDPTISESDLCFPVFYLFATFLSPSDLGFHPSNKTCEEIRDLEMGGYKTQFNELLAYITKEVSNSPIDGNRVKALRDFDAGFTDEASPLTHENGNWRNNNNREEPERTNSRTWNQAAEMIQQNTELLQQAMHDMNRPCRVDDDLVNDLANLGAEFRDETCKPGKVVAIYGTCKAKCEKEKIGSEATYTCTKQGWTAASKIDCGEENSSVPFGAFGALVGLIGLI